MNTRQLEYFLAVATELSFTRAAEKLYVSQTAVTKQIRNIEEQLGVKLFERTKKKVVLTPAGRVFQREATNLLEHWKTTEERVKMAFNGAIGSLKIGFSTGSGRTKIGQYMSNFVAHYPSIGVTFKNEPPSELLHMLREGKIDLAFVPLFDEKKYAGVEYYILDIASLVVVMPKNHALSYHEYVTRADMENENLILACSENGALGEEFFIIEPFKKAGLQPNIVARDENVETVLFMVSANIGIAILPEYLAVRSTVGTQRDLAEIPFDPEHGGVRLIAAWNPKNNNPSCRIIIDFLKNQV